MGRLAFEKALQPNLKTKQFFSKTLPSSLLSERLFGAKLILRLSLMHALKTHKDNVCARVGDRLLK